MRKRQGFLAGTSGLQVVLFVPKERISICLVEVYGESVGSFDISDSFFLAFGVHAFLFVDTFWGGLGNTM